MTDASSRPCRRCQSLPAPHTLRNDPTCGPCYIAYVDTKIGRRLGAINRETNPSKQPAPRRYLAGLSFGPSSTTLVKVLDDSAQYHSSKKGSTAFEPTVVYVDTDLSSPQGPSSGDGQPGSNTPLRNHLDQFKTEFSKVEFQVVPLSRVAELGLVDWSSLEKSHPASEGGEPEAAAQRLKRVFAALPSATSRADLTRLLVRQLLLYLALEGSYNALLFGHNTTSLAALTLSEVANGRGFTIPSQVNDGPIKLYQHAASGDAKSDGKLLKGSIPVYYPVREVLKFEIMTYLELNPNLKVLLPEQSPSTTSVVSHKDVAIDEVMRRYFEGVEGPYSGIVANVVRTASKLDRVEGTETCTLCGMTLDQRGDSTWAGQLGELESASSKANNLCYGCRRTVKG